MKIGKAPRKSARGKNIFLTFLLLLSIPVVVYGVLQESSLDIRNQAFNEVEVSEDTPCVISFANVNPYSLEVDKTVRLQADALSTTLGVKAISIQDESGTKLLEKTYSDTPKQVTETFTFTPTEAKAYNLKGIMLDISNKSYACVISSPYDIQGIRAISNNSKPTFTSTPKDSIPSQAIKTEDTYEYTLTAQDPDGDTINYSYSFTPKADWLKPTIIENGSNGKLTIKFQGSTTNAASYLANIFIHDGYSTHISSQSWVISVSPKENDIPSVKILSPLESIKITSGNTLAVAWDATDLNHITKFQLYISSNPTNEKSWIPVNENISYDKSTYSIDLTNIKDGTYRTIVRALDNQTPQAEGLGISEEIILARGNTPSQTDDQVVLPEPQVINISPTSTDTVKNPRTTIKASLVATEGSTINENSIKISLDNTDITKDVSINKISESEYTLIYLPPQNLNSGMHKVSINFKDSSDSEVTKDWTFTIESSETQQDENSFNIFGYSISKRNTYIIGGGLLIIVLAILVPILISAVWKDENTQSNSNPVLPPTTPTEDNIPMYSQPSAVTQLTKEQQFSAPEPEILDLPQEPTTDQVEDKDSNPPEPIL